MKYKLIAADFDDTILHSDHTYSQELIDAIKAYKRAGGIFAVATGRMVETVKSFYTDNGLTGELIAYQGAVTVDVESGAVLHEERMTTEDAASVSAYLDALGVYHQLYEFETGTVVTCEMDDYGKRYQKFVGCCTREMHMPLAEYIRKTDARPLKLIALEDPSKIARHMEELDKIFGHVLGINTSKEWMIEIISAKADKGTALARLAAKHGIRQEEVIAIGDSMNDASMLRYAGLGVAVGNASPVAKAAADMLAPTNDADGVAYIIRELGMRN